MKMELFTINNVKDAINARQKGRELARDLGFGIIDQTRIAYAISELSSCFVETRQSSSQIQIGAIRSETGKTGIEWSMIGDFSFSPEMEVEWGSLWTDEWDFAITRREGIRTTFRKWLPFSYDLDAEPVQLQLFATGEEKS